MCSSLPEIDIFRCPAVNLIFVRAALYENRIVLVKYLKLVLWGNCYCSGHSYPSPERVSPLVPQLSANMLCVSGKLDFFPAAFLAVIHF